MSTVVKLIRSDSLGIAGTYKNIDHHAEVMRPFVEAMERMVPHLGFKEWKQGHNVHEFVAHGGQRYTLRAFRWNGDDGEGEVYAGIRLALRVSRELEYPLIDISEVADVPRLMDAMRMIAVGMLGFPTGVMKKDKQ